MRAVNRGASYRLSPIAYRPSPQIATPFSSNIPSNRIVLR